MIVTHRVTMQQRRVDTLVGEEFYVRQLITSATADQTKAESAMRAWQSRIAENPGTNSPLYLQYQDALATLRSDADRAATLLQQYRSWQAELASALRAEQSKVNDLLDRLNKVEAALQGIPAGRP